MYVTFWICLFCDWGLSSHSRIFHSYGEVCNILKSLYPSSRLKIILIIDFSKNATYDFYECSTNAYIGCFKNILPVSELQGFFANPRSIHVPATRLYSSRNIFKPSLCETLSDNVQGINNNSANNTSRILEFSTVTCKICLVIFYTCKLWSIISTPPPRSPIISYQWIICERQKLNLQCMFCSSVYRYKFLRLIINSHLNFSWMLYLRNWPEIVIQKQSVVRINF